MTAMSILRSSINSSSVSTMLPRLLSLPLSDEPHPLNGDGTILCSHSTMLIGTEAKRA